MERLPVIGIACGIFIKEIHWLIANGELDIPFVFLDSTLHMTPDKLQESLHFEIVNALETYQRVLLVYGDCHAYMDNFYDPIRVIRVEGINCCEIMLGRDRYRMLRKQGAFFVMAEWAHKWQEIFVESIGLTEKNAPIFMNSMHKGITYVDAGIEPVPVEILEEMAQFFDLPYQVITADLTFLKQAILKSNVT